MYFRNAAAAIVVYDVTDRSSLDKVEEWVQLIRLNAARDITISIVGNKVDLVNSIDVPIAVGKG